MDTNYVYPGFRPFVDKAAEDHKIPEADRHRLTLGPLFREIDDALGQLPGMADRERRMLIPKGSTQALVDRLRATREVLAVQLHTVDLAIHEVLGALGMRKEPNLAELLDPEDLADAKPKTKPKTTPKAKD